MLLLLQLLAKLLQSKDPNDLRKANKLIQKMVKQVRPFLRKLRFAGGLRRQRCGLTRRAGSLRIGRINRSRSACPH